MRSGPRRQTETVFFDSPVVSKAESQEFEELLRGSRRVLVFTGAGVSTASGIPDFRGPGGVWTRRQPVMYEDFMTSKAARVEHWDYKLEGWGAFRAARPTATHEAVVALERAGRLEMLVTQNIDGLHSLAGTSAERQVEIHGTNSALECQGCCRRFDPAPHFEAFQATREPPLCPKCGGFLKPATISFGQTLREEEVARACAAADRADLAVSLGSTLSVHPAAGVPLRAAARGIPYVIINRGVTDQDAHPSVTLRLEGPVDEIFAPAVARALAAVG